MSRQSLIEGWQKRVRKGCLKPWGVQMIWCNLVSVTGTCSLIYCSHIYSKNKCLCDICNFIFNFDQPQVEEISSVGELWILTTASH